jgi:hypothetical protein
MMRCHRFAWISTCCFMIAGWATDAAAVENVRVDASSGAPRIVVDGKAVRARIFWGAPSTGTVPAEETGQTLTFEFSPPEDVPAGATMHFRFGSKPGDIYLDDIRCVDLGTGQDVFPVCGFEAGMESFHQAWNIWPPAAKNTVGTVTVEPGKGHNGSAGLHVALKAPADSVWPDFHIFHHANLALRLGHRYRVSVWARAQPARDVAIALFRPATTYHFLGGPPGPFQPQIKLAAAAGVDFVSFPMDLPWPKPGETVDWSSVDTQCRTVLEANPKALLIPRIGMDPPAWWYDLHPDDRMVWDHGTSTDTNAVVASPNYRRDAAERLAALVAHVEKAFGDHVAGYHPAGQNTGEWFYQDTWSLPLNGYAKGDLVAWRAWLKARYHDDAALRAAWLDPRVTLATAAVPSPAARRAAPAGTLRDPATERCLIDFALFQQEAMADCVCPLAHAVRQASHGRKLVLFFFGYVFEFGPVANGPATCGHYGLRRVLNCPDIDVLCSPISYFDRGLGQSAPAMTAAESVALAGKMWLYEDDTRTYLVHDADSGQLGGVDTIEKTNNELLRNTAQCALRNFATWWMDLGATGWFNDPRMWAEMARLKLLDEPLLQNPRPFRPEVAAVIDPQSMIRVAAGGHAVTIPGVYEVRRPLGRMGAPYGQYLQDDVAAGRVGAKMYVFLTAWCLSPSERRQLLDATRDALRVWCYAPGFQEENGTSLDAMRQLTGFQIKSIAPTSAWAEPTEPGRKLGLLEGFGVRGPIKPLFAAADATAAETLATYPDGSAAVALRRTGKGWSLFVGPPGLTSELLRLAARQASVHLVAQSDCNVYANGPYLVLHASKDGPLEIDAGQAGSIRDLLTGQTVGEGPKIILPLKMGETRVLRVGR